MKYIPVLLSILFLGACQPGSRNEKSASRESSAAVPAPGSIVAEDSMPVTEDQLNHSSFRVRVKAGEYSAQGTYTVEAAYGNNIAENQFTMPRGGAQLRPLLRKGTEPYTFVIGFRQAGDDTFYEYYQVQASRGTISMQYLKAYSFQ